MFEELRLGLLQQCPIGLMGEPILALYTLGLMGELIVALYTFGPMGELILALYTLRVTYTMVIVQP